MDPFIPLGVPGGVRLFVLGLEDTDNLAVWVAGKVAARAALRYHAGVYLLADGGTDAFDDGVEFGLGHGGGWQLGHGLGSDGTHAFWRLEDGVVDLQAVLLAQLGLASTALEARGNLVGPAFKAGIDGLEVDAGVAASAVSELWPRGIRPRTRHA